MFETLFAKTFTILGSQLFVTWLTTVGVIAWIRHLYFTNAECVTGTTDAEGKLDLDIDWDSIKLYFYVLLVVDFAVFLFLLFKGTNNLVIGIPLFTIWSILTGIELALALISVDENLGGKVLAITATMTFMAAGVGIYSGIKFAALGPFLFIALTLLLLGNLIRLFISIPRTSQRIMAFFGVVTFSGYLLFDFGRLEVLAHHPDNNSWYVAMDLAINIYLDIINLFLHLLDLLSK
jgi:uncharacterized protein